METRSRKRTYQRMCCEHCAHSLSKSTWYDHFAKFYDPMKKKWQKVDEDNNFERSSEDDSSDGSSTSPPDSPDLREQDQSDLDRSFDFSDNVSVHIFTITVVTMIKYYIAWLSKSSE